MNLLYTVFCRFLCNHEENLFNNQELLYLAIIFFILMTVVFDLVATLLGEIRWLSLQGIKMLTSAPWIFTSINFNQILWWIFLRILMNGRVYSCLAATWRMTLEALNNSSWSVELLKFTILFILFSLTHSFQNCWS